MIYEPRKNALHKLATIIIHWPRLGPYHIARIRAATEYLAQYDLRLVALELFGSDNEYLWEWADHDAGIERHTLFPQAAAGNISKTDVFRGIWKYLNRLQPPALAING